MRFGGMGMCLACFVAFVEGLLEQNQTWGLLVRTLVCACFG